MERAGRAVEAGHHPPQDVTAEEGFVTDCNDLGKVLGGPESEGRRMNRGAQWRGCGPADLDDVDLRQAQDPHERCR